MSPLVSLTLFAWPLVVLMMFGSIPKRKAILVAYIGGWMFLPEATFNITGIPDYGKLPAASLGVLVSVLLFDSSKLFEFRPGLVDLPITLWLLAPLASSLSNGLGLYDGLSGVWTLFLMWGVPLLMGRVYFSTPSAMKELALGLVLGALIYVPLCWVEVRLSPQLHRWVYGFHPQEFEEAIRYGGFRPMVFMDNGLAVATFVSSGGFLAFWLWRGKVANSLAGLPLSLVFALIAVTTLLCKSANGVFTLAVGVVAFFFLRAVPVRATILLLAAAPPTYMALRASDQLKSETLISFAEMIDEHRAHSLGARLQQEDLFSDHTWNRPCFGWGGWMRNFPKNEQGESMTRGVDAMWTIALSKHGLFGLAAWAATLLIGPVVFACRVPPRKWLSKELVPSTAVAILILLWAVDNLFNGLLQPMFILGMGGLASCGARWASATQGTKRRVLVLPSHAAVAGTAVSLLLVACCVQRSEAASGEVVGVNEGAASYFHPEVRLANLAHRAEGWVSRKKDSQAWTDGRSIEVDAYGYPAKLEHDQVAIALITTHNGENYPVGKYLLTWTGAGNVELFHRDAKLVSRSSNLAIYEISATSPNGLQIALSDTSPDDPPRDLSLSALGARSEGSFHADYVAQLARFDVIRLMDIARTNGSKQREWSDRPTPKSLLWSKHGWPWEVQIELANRTRTPVWVCVPHQASDNYVEELARLIDQYLSPTIPVWVQYSNELWNDAEVFSQGRWVEENLTDRHAPSRMAAAGRRAAEVWAIFERALGDQRVVNVIGGQAGNSAVLKDAIRGAGLVMGVQPEVASYAAYFHAPIEEVYQCFLQDPDDKLPALKVIARSLLLSDAKLWEQNAKQCEGLGLRIVAYEGGSHLVSEPKRFSEPEWIEYLADLHRDSRMRKVYGLLRKKYREAGGDGIVYYNRLSKWSKWGSWGHLESPLDVQSPRWLAVQDHLTEARAPTPLPTN